LGLVDEPPRVLWSVTLSVFRHTGLAPSSTLPTAATRGAISAPARTLFRQRRTSAMLPGLVHISRTPKTPFATNRGKSQVFAGRRLTWLKMCTCISHNPGMAYAPLPSTSRVPLGSRAVALGPTWVMRSRRISIV
jgi:hypothetical protein